MRVGCLRAVSRKHLSYRSTSRPEGTTQLAEHHVFVHLLYPGDWDMKPYSQQHVPLGLEMHQFRFSNQMCGYMQILCSLGHCIVVGSSAGMPFIVQQ